MIPVNRAAEPDVVHRALEKYREWLEEQPFHHADCPAQRHKIQSSDLKKLSRSDSRTVRGHLYDAYGGVCAYLSIRIEKGAGYELDHFLPKSLYPGLAYDWGNFRLACSGINHKKNDAEGIADPCDISQHAFHLNLLTGAIFPSPDEPAESRQLLQRTIDVLGLDSEENRSMRAGRYYEYLSGQVSGQHLAQESPHLWQEVRRQGYLRTEGAAAAPLQGRGLSQL